MNIDVVIESNDVLGEGPVWSSNEQALYWVDIHRKLLQRWDLSTQERKIWELPSEIGSFAFREAGGIVVAMRNGIGLLDLDNSQVTPICNPEADLAYTRFNDGKCDRQGRFWAGTMDEESPKRRASLYRLDAYGRCQKVIEGIGISNGLGWSPDNRFFYYTDSAAHTIYAYDYFPEDGRIANKRIFASTPDGYVPDGLTVDSSGFIWSANWDGWKVIRYSPDGKIDLEVPVPVQRPTSCAFGGPDLNLLFVTSARIGLSQDDLIEQPMAGSIFCVETDVKGLPTAHYAG
ncbi:MAG: SMP-30/gluconolactonase/LRE family protein [Anaerolineales bacterium]|nr:SMP-30/gluconolactonase/LRE family protein [Anaerolineales bacterium]